MSGAGARDERALWIVVLCAIAMVAAASAARFSLTTVLGVIVAGFVVVAYQRTLLSWQTMLGGILLVILFVPIRRYEIGAGLPVQLEPYRILLVLILACWFCALAVDPDVRWRRIELEAPVCAVIATIFLSIALNITRVNNAFEAVFKQLTFFASYFLLAYFISSVVVSRDKLYRILVLFVGGGTVLSVLALVEWRTGTNLFGWYGEVLPFMRYIDLGETVNRGAGVRAIGSAQHAIALGAALVMLVPMAVYLHRRSGHVAWLGCALVLTMGALSTGSRTAAIMLITLALTFIIIKPRDTIRLLPLLLTATIVIQIAMPGTLGTFRSILQPSYLIREQSVVVGTGNGRLADLGPAFDEWSEHPWFGGGFGTRGNSQEPGAGYRYDPLDLRNQILDDQWLGWLISVGVAGVVALAWLFGRVIRRLAHAARGSDDSDGWLTTGLAASLASFAVGMFTFDAFAFVQVTLFAFIMFGFAAVATRDDVIVRPSASRLTVDTQAQL